MKISLIVTAILSLSCFSEAFDIPVLCEEATCTEAMIIVEKKFQSLNTAPDFKKIPKVFSGECLMLNFGPDPMVTQHGVVLLDLQSENPVFSALFSFFAGTNPYSDLTVQTARKRLEEGGSSPAPLRYNAETALVEFKTSGSLISYWIRQDTTSQNLVLLSKWDYGGAYEPNEIFCELKPNQNQ